MISEAHSTFGYQHHVLALGHDQACQLYRIGDVIDRSNSAGGEITTIHNGGIHLDLAVLVEHRATTGIEHRIVFEQTGTGLYCLQCGTTEL